MDDDTARPVQPAPVAGRDELVGYGAACRAAAFGIASIRRRTHNDPRGRRALVDGLQPAAIVADRLARYADALADAVDRGVPFEDARREFVAELAAVVAAERRHLDPAEHADALAGDLRRFAAQFTGAEPDEPAPAGRAVGPG